MVAVSVVVATISPWSGVLSTGSGFHSSPAVFGEQVDVLARTETPDVGGISTSRNLAESFTDQVQFDNYSLIIKGQRVFLQYVVFHSISPCSHKTIVQANSTLSDSLFLLCGLIFFRSSKPRALMASAFTSIWV
jgi:hypothetical protein